MYNISFSLGRLELRHELLNIVLPNYQNDTYWYSKVSNRVAPDIRPIIMKKITEF